VQRAHTIGLIRALQAAGPLVARRGRGRRVPRQQQPDAIRLEYFKAITPATCDLARTVFERVAQDRVIQLLRQVRARQGLMDAADDPRDRELRRQRAQAGNVGRALRAGEEEGLEAGRLIDLAARRFTDVFRPRDLYAVAAEFGERTSRFNKQQLGAQVHAAIGVPLSAIEKPVRDRLDEFAARNVDLIKTVPDRYFDSLRQTVLEAFRVGDPPASMAADLADRYEISKSDALRIARDQIGKLNGQVNQDRQRSMGLDSYIWRGVQDNRERDEHLEREGLLFSWDDPPPDGHPGEPIQCRCSPEPNFAALGL
jgi:SPP1 gp7 family putative phage head morphogenesis protein